MTLEMLHGQYVSIQHGFHASHLPHLTVSSVLPSQINNAVPISALRVDAKSQMSS